jgi:hypothetical protein
MKIFGCFLLKLSGSYAIEIVSVGGVSIVEVILLFHYRASLTQLREKKKYL